MDNNDDEGIVCWEDPGGKALGVLSALNTWSMVCTIQFK